MQHPLSGGIKTSRKRGAGSDALTDDSESLWYGPIAIGTPGVTFTGMIFLSAIQKCLSDPRSCIVDFDTGSSDLFVPSSTCTTNCEGHTEYNPSDSSSSADLGKAFMLNYGDGSSVDGEEYTDVVEIAGLTVCSVLFFSSTKLSPALS